MLSGTVKCAVLLFTCSYFQSKLFNFRKGYKVGPEDNYASDLFKLCPWRIIIKFVIIAFQSWLTCTRMHVISSEKS